MTIAHPTRASLALGLAAELTAAVEQQHRALDAFAAGDPEPLKVLYSRRDDATLANPFGPPVRGWSDVEPTLERAAEHYRDGYATGFELVSHVETAELACVVEIERFESRIGGVPNVGPIALRVTTVFRREDDGWRIVHRHADPKLSAQPAEVVLAR